MVAYKVRKGDGTWYTLGSGTGATAKIRRLDGTWAADDGTGLLAKVRKADGTMATGVDFSTGSALDPGQLYPDDWTEVRQGTAFNVQAFGAPAVEAISDGDDLTYMQMRQGSSLYAWVKWKLPALTTSGITSAQVFSRLYWDPTPLAGFTVTAPQGITRLTYPADGLALLQDSYPTLTASTYTDWNPVIDVSSTTNQQTNFSGFLAALAAGDAELWTTLSPQTSKETRLNVVELYLSLT